MDVLSGDGGLDATECSEEEESIAELVEDADRVEAAEVVPAAPAVSAVSGDTAPAGAAVGGEHKAGGEAPLAGSRRHHAHFFPTPRWHPDPQD